MLLGRGRRRPLGQLLSDPEKIHLPGFDEVLGSGSDDHQCRLQYFKEIRNLFARRHPVLPPPGVGYWNRGRRDEALDPNYTVTAAQLARWNQQLASAVVAASTTADIHHSSTSPLSRLGSLCYGDNDVTASAIN